MPSFTIERLVDGVMNPLWKPVVTIEAETHEEALARFRESGHRMSKWSRVRVVPFTKGDDDAHKGDV